MSGDRHCELYVTNMSDMTLHACKPTHIQGYIDGAGGDIDIAPGESNILVAKTKGTSGSATGSHLEEEIYVSGHKDRNYIIDISCPFTAENSFDEVSNNTLLRCENALGSPHGDARVYATFKNG